MQDIKTKIRNEALDTSNSGDMFSGDEIAALLNSKLDSKIARIMPNDPVLFGVKDWGGAGLSEGSMRRIKDSQLYKSVISEDTLKKFAIYLGKIKNTPGITAYRMAIPAPQFKQDNGNNGHAVSLTIDSNKKEILYHDSCGLDMWPEMKDVLGIVFDKWNIKTNYDKNQPRSRDGIKDGSCSLLSILNSYSNIKGQLGQEPDSELDFSKYKNLDISLDRRSRKFREYLWDEFGENIISKELAKRKSVEATNIDPAKSTYKFSSKVTIKRDTSGDIDEDYELCKSPEYKTMLADIKKVVRSNELFTKTIGNNFGNQGY